MKKTIYILLIALLMVACGRGRSGRYVTVDGFALGTTYHIIADLADTTGLQADIDALFEEVNNSMSVYRENSLINRLNRGETDTVDRHIAHMIETAARVSGLSGGRYDITIKPVTEAWGFNAEEATADPNIDSLMQYVGYRKIRITDGRLVKDSPNMRIELNSIAKGYTVDLLSDMLRTRGSGNYIVEVGGEIMCRGLSAKGREWVVGIDKPAEGNYIPGADMQMMVRLTDAGMATSGNYRKFYYDAHGNKIVHTINALTGRSELSRLLSATVIAENCTLADAYGTMMMTLGVEASQRFLDEHSEVLAILICDDGAGGYEVLASPGMYDKLVR